MIKLVYGTKNKIVKHQGKSFHELRTIITANFPEVPVDYSLSYLDEDKDQICLNSDQDLVNMFNTPAKCHKVYIKQSLSQTVVIDVQRSDYIEPSFESSVREDKDEDRKLEQKIDFSKKVQEKVAQIDEPQVQIELSQASETVEIQKDIIPEEFKQEIKIEVSEEKSEPEKSSTELSVIRDIPKQMLEVSEVIEIPVENSAKRVIDTLEIKPEQYVFSSYEAGEEIGSKKEESKSEEPKREEPKREEKREEPKREEPKRQPTRAKIFGDFELDRRSSNKEELLVHNVICSRCKDDFGILGIRYQCILCDNYDLCSNCEQEVEHEHALLKVKKPIQAITKEQIINKYRKDLQPENPLLPPGHYIPSISKDETQMLIEAAKESYEQGLNRSKKLMEELYYKLSMSHKNPYEMGRPVAPVPVPPKKVETVYQKATNLREIVGISQNQAMRFATQYPNHTSEQIIEIYLRMKSHF